MKNSLSVSAIVVTYNRKKEVIRCLKALLKQDYYIKNILIIDNASTDCTLEELKKLFDFNKNIKENQFLCLGSTIDSNKIYYYRSSINKGGSYGFYMGMKLASENLKTDLYWMMDDDGYPEERCLSILIKNLDNYDYIMPTSIDINNHSKLSWPTRLKGGKKTDSYKKLKNSWGKIMNFVTPFNGALLTQDCINKVGYVNKNFFIWGDEYDHYWRCKQQNIDPVTIIDAEFYHPSQKLPLVDICFGRFRVPYVNSKVRMICLARNYTYIYIKYNQLYKIPLKFLQYTWLFIFTRHFDFRGWLLYIASVHDGIIGDFSRHKKYLK